MPKIVVCRELGPPESLHLEEIPSAPLGPGEVRVAIRAAGLEDYDSDHAQRALKGFRMKLQGMLQSAAGERFGPVRLARFAAGSLAGAAFIPIALWFTLRARLGRRRAVPRAYRACSAPPTGPPHA